LQRAPQRPERVGIAAQREARLVRADADVAVAPERSFEEEGVPLLLFVEETEDAERRQQITGKLNGCGCSASKAGSGKGSACREP
jgi:hypothetical protein